MRELSDLAARERDAEPLGDDVHESGFQIGILNNPGDEAARLAGGNQPVAETGMGALGHADEKFLLERGDLDALFFGHGMVSWQDDDDLVVGNTFPLKIFAGCGRAQANEPEIDFAGFKGAQLFGRRHVEEI